MKNAFAAPEAEASYTPPPVENVEGGPMFGGRRSGGQTQPVERRGQGARR